MASFISNIFSNDQTKALYTRIRYHLTRVQHQIAAFLLKKGMSEQHALPVSNFATVLLVINFPFALTLLGLFTCIFTSFASGACAVLTTVVLSFFIVLSIGCFMLSLLMFGACTVLTLLSTTLIVSAACCAVSIYALVLSYKGPKFFRTPWKPFGQTTQSNSNSDHHIDIPNDPGAGITTPTKHSPTSSFDHDAHVDSTIASDCSGSAE